MNWSILDFTYNTYIYFNFKIVSLSTYLYMNFIPLNFDTNGFFYKLGFKTNLDINNLWVKSCNLRFGHYCTHFYPNQFTHIKYCILTENLSTYYLPLGYVNGFKSGLIFSIDIYNNYNFEAIENIYLNESFIKNKLGILQDGVINLENPHRSYFTNNCPAKQSYFK